MILNLTQHPATPEQVSEGVVEPECKALIQSNLTFNTHPTREEIELKALALTQLAHICMGEQELGLCRVLIGGAPYLMGALELALKEEGLQPVYAYSERASVEITEPDGSVVKTNVFKHKGFIEV